jgi:Domain of unknown function (DUF5658)
MNDDSTGGRRYQVDRRRRPTSPLDTFRLRGRRTWPRREEERRGTFFVDRFAASTLAMVVALLSLTIADGVLTIELLDINSEEINPFMGQLLARGHFAFLAGKYLLTAAGLPFIVIYQSYTILGTRFRVGFLLPVFISLYVALLSYQWMLFHIGRNSSPAARAGATLGTDSPSTHHHRRVLLGMPRTSPPP